MRYAISVVMCALALCGCGSGATGETTPAGNATPGADQKSVQTTGLVTADVKNRCAGFGATQAADILGVPAGSITATSQDITPTARGCEFTGGGKKISFSLSLEASIDDAKRAIENTKETYVISARAQEGATGKEIKEGAYSDILGVGDEAIWSVTNGAMTVRHKNLIIMVMSPDDKRTQAAIATKILGLL
jgi:hypothetical protein